MFSSDDISARKAKAGPSDFPLFSRHFPRPGQELDTPARNLDINSPLDSGAQIIKLRLPNRMNLALESIGLIAGSCTPPLDFARLARAAGVRRIVAVAAQGETDPALASLVDEIVWLNVGQLGKMISTFTSRGIKQCIMAGQLAPKNLFDLRPDLRAVGVL